MKQHQITGASRLIALIGNPIHSARSPLLVNDLLMERGLFGAYLFIPMAVTQGQWAPTIAGLRQIENFAGALVTMPFKQAIIPLLDRLSTAAQIVGAVNAIRRHADGTLQGDILDGVGFVAGLRAAGHEVTGTRCLVYGSGGAASAIVCALAEQGAAVVDIQNRTPVRAVALAAKVSAHWPSCQVRPAISPMQHYDVVINATSLGMADDDPVPIPLEVIMRAEVVADIIVTREMTPLLTLAHQHGKTIHTGLPMLQGQLDLFVDFIGVGQA